MLDRTQLSPLRTLPIDWDDLFRQASEGMPLKKQSARLFFSEIWKEWVIEPLAADYRGPVLIAINPPPLAEGEEEVRVKKGHWVFYGVAPTLPEQAELALN